MERLCALCKLRICNLILTLILTLTLTLTIIFCPDPNGDSDLDLIPPLTLTLIRSAGPLWCAVLRTH